MQKKFKKSTAPEKISIDRDIQYTIKVGRTAVNV
jgi:hypothetical protein